MEIIYKLLPKTDKMNTDEYKQNLREGTTAMEQHLAKFVISDFRDFHFLVTPNLQEWLAEEISPRWNAMNIERVAVIMPQEFIENLAVEQMIEESEQKNILKYQLQYFSTYEEARVWFGNA